MPAFQAGDEGSIPSTRTMCAPVAQRIEQDGSNVKAGGSIPSWGTI